MTHIGSFDSEVFTISKARIGLTSGRIREARERAQLTQADVARAVGVSPACVSRWENSNRRPSRHTAVRLQQLFEILEQVAEA